MIYEVRPIGSEVYIEADSEDEAREKCEELYASDSITKRKYGANIDDYEITNVMDTDDMVKMVHAEVYR